MNQPAPKKPSGQTVRIITGLVLGLGALLIILFSPFWLLALVVAAISGLGMREYIALVSPGPWRLEACAGLVVAALLPLSALAGPMAVAGALGLALAATAGAAFLAANELDNMRSGLIRLFFGVFYLGGLLSCLLLAANLPQGRMLLIFLIAVVAAADTGAYFIGRLLGRHNMAPRISPKKTWEGLLGGLVSAAAVGALFTALVFSDINLGIGAFLGLALGALSVLGDLLESLIKRAAGAKDSGSLLPGHGGVLDRIDGLLLAAPGLLLAWVLLWP